MRNAAQTQPPRPKAGINAGETLPPGGKKPEEPGLFLAAGESIADSYIIRSRMENQGKQATVYLAQKWGKSYAVKVYGKGWRPSEKLQRFLSGVSHPNLARVVDQGDYQGCYYEIYDYYPEGTLEEAGALSAAHIQEVIVPSVNEGLHELHRNGIVHCDLKPGNLFYANQNSRVVIGDCGVSGYLDASGKLVDSLRGTPEYAPPVKALLWSGVLTPAYDYGSFGLVLCRAVLGRSLFEGMSVEEIAAAWEAGLELPAKINGRLGALIRGLLNENEEERWGYSQVKRWCEGEYQRPVGRGIYAAARKKSPERPLIFGRFEDQTLSVSTLHQLSLAIRGHWDQARRVVRRRELVDFVRRFDEGLAGTVRELSLLPDADAAVYRLLLAIDEDPGRIFYQGKDYGEFPEYLEQLSGGRDQGARQFLSSGMVICYLRHNGYDPARVDRLEELIRRNGCGDMAAITTICFALQGTKSVEVSGASLTNLEDLVELLAGYSLEEADALIQSDRFVAWMNRLGYEKEMRRMKGEFC